jgi:hypothetical protein
VLLHKGKNDLSIPRFLNLSAIDILHQIKFIFLFFVGVGMVLDLNSGLPMIARQVCSTT